MLHISETRLDHKSYIPAILERVVELRGWLGELSLFEPLRPASSGDQSSSSTNVLEMEYSCVI